MSTTLVLKPATLRWMPAILQFAKSISKTSYQFSRMLAIGVMVLIIAPSLANAKKKTGHNTPKAKTGTTRLYKIKNNFSGPVFSYGSAKTYITNSAITPFTPTSTGVDAPGYNTPVSVGTGFSGPLGVATDAAGNIYVADRSNNAVKKISADGSTTTTIGSGFVLPYGVAVDATGNVYVADYGNNAVKKIVAGTGAIVTVGVGLSHPTSVAVDRIGNVYVADLGNNAIKKIDKNDYTVEIGAGFSDATGVAVDELGNVYVADSGNGAIKKIAAGGGVATLATGFSTPSGLALDATGNVLVADYGDQVIKKVPITGGTPIVVVGSLSGAYSIAIDAAGIIYTANFSNNTIKKSVPSGGFYLNTPLPYNLLFDNTTGTISGYPGVASLPKNYLVTAYNSTGSTQAVVNIQTRALLPATVSYGAPKIYALNTAITSLVPSTSGVGTAGSGNVFFAGSGLTGPSGVAVDAYGNIYVADATNKAVKKIPVNGGDPIILALGLNAPTGVAVDAFGNVYVTDAAASAVKKIPVGGGAIVSVGSGFSTPAGVAVDAAGNVYIADIFGNVVKKVAAGGGAVSTVLAGLNHPFGVAVDAAGNIYVSDTDNNAVKKIPADGSPVVTVGSGLSSPYGLAVDALGNVYVADHGNSVVKKIPVGGGAPVIVGTAYNGVPRGVAVDATGVVYLADQVISQIKVIVPSGGYAISPALPAGLSFDETTGAISGTPTALSPAANYTITAYNNGGGTSTTVNIAVRSVLPATVSYATPKTIFIGSSITPLSPTSTGVNPAGYNIPTVTAIADFANPYYIAMDVAGNLYLSDDANGVVKKYPAGGGAGVVIGSGFNHPKGLAVDTVGNVYVADCNNNSVKKIPVAGGAIVTIGSGFLTPTAVGVDKLGNVFVADLGNSVIKKIPVGGGAPAIFGSGTNQAFYMTIDKTGNVYISCSNIDQVKKIAADGSSTTVIGSGFLTPIGLSVDAAGNVYVADKNHNMIRQIPIGGGAPVTVAVGFNNPLGLVSDATGNFYVADLSGTVKKLAPSGGYYVNPVLPAGLVLDVNNGNIYGTPTTVTPATNYTVTAYNNGGSTSTVINLNTIIPPPPVVGYSTPNDFYTGTPITPLTPASTGVNAFAYGAGLTYATSAGNPTGITTDAAGSVYVTNNANTFVLKLPSNNGAAVQLGTGLSQPADVVLDAANNLYVADFNTGKVKKILASDGSTIILASGFLAPTGIALDAAGNVYVADISKNSVTKLPVGGGTPVPVGSGWTNPFGVKVDVNGNVYVSEYGNPSLKMIPAGSNTAVLRGSGFGRPTGITLDPGGNIFVADQTQNKVVMIPAGNGTPVVVASGLSFPQGVAIDGRGNMFIAQYTNSAIKKVAPVGGYFLDKPLPAGLSFDNNTGIISGTPTALSAATTYKVTAYNSFGTTTTDVLIAVKLPLPPKPVISYNTPNTLSTGTAVTLSPVNAGSPIPAIAYNSVSTLAGSSAVGALDGTGAAATFNGSCAMVTDAAGNIFVADGANNIIRKITPAGVVSTFAGSGAVGAANGTGIAASFSNPFGIAMDAAGNIYVGDTGNHLIRKITPAAVVSTFAGSIVGNVDATGAAAKFNTPRGIAIDAADNLFVVDYNNSKIRKITPAGVVTTFAGSGVLGNADGTGIAASFRKPYGIDIDAAGNLYVADAGNKVIRKITPAAVVSTFAGSGATGFANGTGTAAIFNNPYDVALDAADNLYVADGSNNMIRKITPAGVVTTQAGTGTAGSGNGLGSAATFNNPHGVAVDATGNIYVADFGANLIRKITLTGYTIAPALPAGLVFNSATGVISGTPTAASPVTNYTITGYNSNGNSVTTMSIVVVLSAPPLPVISYNTPNTLSTGTAVTLSPVNAGSPIPAIAYNSVSTLAGSGAVGALDGTGTAATFNGSCAMVTDAAGNIFVADGANNIIRKITPAGVVSTFAGSGAVGAANGTGIAASFSNPFGIAMDSAGNIYVGDIGNHLIRKITPAAVVSTFAGSIVGNVDATGAAAKFNTPRGIAIDAADNLFVVDYNNSKIRKITPAGVVTTFAGSGVLGNADGTGIAASFRKPYGIDIDAAGNLYVADAGNKVIRKITPAAVVSTFAGSGATGFANGTGTAAIFNNPYDVALDAADNLYVADGSNNMIRKITPAGVVTTQAGTGTAGSANGVGSAATFNNPHGVAVDATGTIYVADFGANIIRKITLTGYTIAPALPAGLVFNSATGVISGTPTAASPATNYTITGYNSNGNSLTTMSIAVVLSAPPLPVISYNTPNTLSTGTAVTLSPVNAGSPIPAIAYNSVSTLAGSGAVGALDGTGTAATFNGSCAMVTDAAGNIFVADGANNIIRKITPAGVVSTFAGSGAVGAANGTGIAASFSNPFGIAMDAAGNIYVGDTGNHLIRKITPAAVVSTFAGSIVGNVDATGAAAKFNTPRGIAIDAADNLFVVDYNNSKIRKITPAGVVTTFAGSGVLGNADGTGIAASFRKPYGIDIDAAGNLYVADAGNKVIRKITPAAVVSTFAGSGATGFANGTGTAAIFNNPYDVALDAADNLYVADGSNNLIRKITPAGVVTTQAGTGTAGSGNGVGSAATFNNPHGVAVDATGNIYVADFGANLIRKITLTGYTIAPALPAGLVFNSATGVISGTPTAASPPTNYTITGYNSNGNSVTTVSIAVISNTESAFFISSSVKQVSPELTGALPEVKQGLSPNGDGINDVLIISNIENYPDNRLLIMNNAGVEVYQVKGYDNAGHIFDGHSNKTMAMQKPGTYYYKLEYTDQRVLKYKTGFIIIKY